jgi:hypothetical protein
VNDLKNLLERALADGRGPARDADADPSGDLARGKRLLLRRSRYRMLASSAAAAVAAAIAVPIALSGSPAQAGLVAYTGAQPPGYVVKEIPAGWVIQGTNAYALTIAPASDADQNPDSYLGKLVVMQGEFSTADAAADGWVATTAAGRTAYYNHGQPSGDGTVTAGFVIEQAPGRWLTVQAPASLAWTEAQFKEFALGVTILATAKPSQG